MWNAHPVLMILVLLMKLRISSSTAKCHDHWPGICIDKIDSGACSCAEAHANGWCQNNDFVTNNCRETCGICDNKECGSFAEISHLLTVNDRIIDVSSPLTENLGGIAALYRTSKVLGSSTHICGASLITSRHLVTAAHCVADSNWSYKIVMGREDLNMKNIGSEYEIEHVEIHPEYNKSKNEYNDVAVITTTHRVQYSKDVWPFCLPESNRIPDGYMKIAGWGQVNGSHTSSMIQTAFAPMIDNSICESLWNQHAPHIRRTDYPDGVLEIVLCAGGQGVDSCKGDSGGPLVYKNKFYKNILIGVIKGGINCPIYPLLPSFYTNIGMYRDWIKQTTELPKPVSIIPDTTNTPQSTGSSCQFPFIYKRVRYIECTTVDDPKGELWCSTKTDNQDNHIKDEWKNCKPEDTTASQIECLDDSHCGGNKLCDRTKKCVDPCNSILCGTNAKCQLSNNGPECFCPGNTQGDPRVSCQPLQRKLRCNHHSHCGNNERCALGSCQQITITNDASLCRSAVCGRGSLCQVKNGRPECFCPSNTQGNPRIQCRPTQESKCSLDGDCPESRFCLGGVCADPCELLLPCKNTLKEGYCKATNHRPTCVCKEGWFKNLDGTVCLDITGHREFEH